MSITVTIVVRELGKTSPEFSLNFELPSVPRVGECISIFDFDTMRPRSQDLIVRKVWWSLQHAGTYDSNGKLRDIMIECDTAVGPYASDDWMKRTETAKVKGLEVEDFEISRNR